MEYKTENRICQNCKNDFTIEPEDFGFYEKIKVPPPTFCPECRRSRRWLWRNERTYYKRKCDAPGHGENIISLYSPEQKRTVYCQEYWWSDEWDAMSYGKDYDFSKPFFEQYRELIERIPIIALSNTQAVNSEYCSSAGWNKNCYLISAAGWNENVSYSNRVFHTKDSMDMYSVDSCDSCYYSSFCDKSYKLFFCFKCNNCVDSYFLYNCRNCTNCFGCVNLVNKNYCIFNEQYSREEYLAKLKEFDLGSYKNLQNIKKIVYEEVYLKSVHKFADIINCPNSTGDYLQNSKNCKNCFDFKGDNNENCKYVNLSGFNAKELYDTGPGAGWGSTLLYEGVDINDSSNIISSVVCYDSTNSAYCFNIQNSNFLFGCYGLQKKNYCILNKQYSKEEYEELLPKIIKHMSDLPYIDKAGLMYKYGEFFPSEISPFAYNETVAQEYFPLSKEEGIRGGYRWQDPEIRNYKIDVEHNFIKDNINEATEEIINKIISCAHAGQCKDQCTEAFKIVAEEFSFYKRMNLPLPRLCPNCRHYERLRQRNPMKLWHRSCMCEKGNHTHQGKCEVEFETSYAPDRPEIVYCEKCYQQEVY